MESVSVTYESVAARLQNSRAFGQYMASNNEDHDDSEPPFFTPSYLTGSNYVDKLEKAHMARQVARREARRKAKENEAKFGNISIPKFSTGIERGVSHKAVEFPILEQEEDPTLTPLPSRWNKDDSSPGLEVQADGRTLRCIGQRNRGERDLEAYAIRADHHMPPQCGIYYFEIEILSCKRDDPAICIGFCTKNVTLKRPIGWESESWAYHSDDGRSYNVQSQNRQYGPPWGQGDIIGCGVNFKENHAFFTKNGFRIGTAFQDINKKSKLYPAVSLKKTCEEIRVNFGRTPFAYNINDIMKGQRDIVMDEIQQTDGGSLVQGLKETDLIQTIVLQFLQHEAHVETAKAFAREVMTQKRALNPDQVDMSSQFDLKDEEDATQRQRIRSSILEGDIDTAISLVGEFYPDVLRDNEQVNFAIRCRKFIELVRRLAYMHMALESGKFKGQTATAEETSQDMDMDQNGAEDSIMHEDGDTDVPPQLVELESRMLEYGKVLQNEYRHDPRKEFRDTLSQVWWLLAYKNPLKEPRVSHLMDMQGRVTVAEEINSAILSSLGKSPSASLETVYSQTAVLLEDMRQNGGPGAFVNIHDVVGKVHGASEIIPNP